MTASFPVVIEFGRRKAVLKDANAEFWNVSYKGKETRKYGFGCKIPPSRIRYLLENLEIAGKRLERPRLERSQ